MSSAASLVGRKSLVLIAACTIAVTACTSDEADTTTTTAAIETVTIPAGTTVGTTTSSTTTSTTTPSQCGQSPTVDTLCTLYPKVRFGQQPPDDLVNMSEGVATIQGSHYVETLNRGRFRVLLGSATCDGDPYLYSDYPIYGDSTAVWTRPSEDAVLELTRGVALCTMGPTGGVIDLCGRYILLEDGSPMPLLPEDERRPCDEEVDTPGGPVKAVSDGEVRGREADEVVEVLLDYQPGTTLVVYSFAGRVTVVLTDGREFTIIPGDMLAVSLHPEERSSGSREWTEEDIPNLVNVLAILEEQRGTVEN